MPFSFNDEIIDAIIQNEHRHVCHPGRHTAPTPAASGRARLTPEWRQLAAACEEGLTPADFPTGQAGAGS